MEHHGENAMDRVRKIKVWLRFAGFTFTFAGAILLAGCGTKVGDVSGSVQYKGKAITSGTVTMVGKDGVPVQTEIAEDGTYKLKGVSVGEVTIAVASPPLQESKAPRKVERKDPNTGKSIETKSGERIASQGQKDSWRAIPIEYSDITLGKLKTTISTGQNNHDIKLN
jgi:hypothetical protein